MLIERLFLLNTANGCIQQIQQLSERLVIIACDWSKLLDPFRTMNLEEYTNSSERSLNC